MTFVANEYDPLQELFYVIKKNLCPLGFTGVTHDEYTEVMLAFYEKNEVSPLLGLFCWAYVHYCE